MKSLFREVSIVATAGCSLLMTGIIWYVQVIQYPLFDLVGRDVWVAYEARYTYLAGLVIAPIMLAELAAGVGLVGFLSRSRPLIAGLLTMALVLIWLSTFLIQVPLHQKLALGWNEASWQALVLSNWIRVALWSFRSLLSLRLLLTKS